MSHRVGDDVSVRVGEGAEPAPETFLWRGRLYLVREVLGHWRERRAWWTGAAARAVHGESQVALTGSASAVGSTAVGSVATGPATTGREPEREVWRVDAGAGRTGLRGVYDLCREVPVSVEGDRCVPAGVRWRLLRVLD
jgi:hypothetical protein